MKYIRTKDGIYEVEKKERAYFEGQPWLYHCKGRYGLVEEKDILDQADTIEKLCDEFVLGETKYHKPCITKLPLGLLKECVVKNVYPGMTLYASIWIDDDLCKIAKMNDKGELELL